MSGKNPLKDLKDKPKKISKKEIEKIFKKYTKNFNDFILSSKKKKGEKDRKDYN